MSKNCERKLVLLNIFTKKVNKFKDQTAQTNDPTMIFFQIVVETFNFLEELERLKNSEYPVT